MEKVAVIEIGMFYAKLKILAVSENNYFIVTDSKQDDFRFELEKENEGFLKKPEIDAMISILKDYRKICDINNVEKTFAIGNFANNNKCKNLNSFIDEIFSQCGFKFVLLSDNEQNQYLYSGIINSMDISKGVIIEVGLDKIHLIQYNRRVILNETIVQMGPLTLLDEQPFNENISSEEHMQMLEKLVEEEISKVEWLKNIDEEYTVIASGDLVLDLTKMVRKFNKHPLDMSNNYVCKKEDIEYISKQIAEIDLNKNKKIKGIREERADVFAVGVMLISKLFAMTAKETMQISTASVATGMLFNQIIPETLEKPLADVLGYSLVAQTSYFDSANIKHNEQVYNLAMLLFKQLRVMHKLSRNYVRILRAAAYLHDVGERVCFDNHSKHSYYVILSSEIYGLTHREQILAAFVASMHDGSDIDMTEWIKYKDLLTEEDLEAIKKLGIIVRLAESLDRTKHAYIIDISCDILGDSVILKTVTEFENMDISFEIKEALKAYRPFEKNFKKKLEII